MPSLTPSQKAALDYSKHLSVTANAGSGKTFVLSKRLVEIALNENVSLRNIVAITFTEKAAGELNRKIAGEINNLLDDETDKARIKKLESLRRQLVSANISTIHSFCIDILKEYSPEAGLDADFIPIDPESADELLGLSIEEYLNKGIVDDEESQKIKYLIRILGSKSSLISQIKMMNGFRKRIEIIEKKIYDKNKSEIAEYFDELFLNKLGKVFNISLIDKCIVAARQINNRVLDSDKDSPFANNIQTILETGQADNLFQKLVTLNKVFEKMLTGANVRQQKYLSKNLRENLETQINLVETVSEDLSKISVPDEKDEINEELANFGLTLLDLFKKVSAIYRNKKTEQGYLDFEDILLLTQALLANEHVRNSLSENFKYIMVDEYQDTNELQYEIFMPILDYLKSGNLFVVGDEKQSIYMFRDAELKVFKRTQSDIKNFSDDAGMVTLPHSFRVSPQIALFTNRVFSRLFAEPNIEFNEIGYEPLVCARKETPDSAIEFLITDSEDDLDEAELVARRIYNLVHVDKTLEEGEIAILFRRRKEFEEVEKALIKYKLKYLIVGGKGFFQRQIIYDVFNYLSFLINEENDAALVGLLRSPFYNFPDTVIFKISLREGDSYYSKLLKYAEEFNIYHAELKLLKSHLEVAQKIEPAKLLRKIIRNTGYSAVVASKKNSEQEIANLEKLFSVAISFSNQSFKSLFDFIEYLKEAIETLSDEGQASVSESTDSIKLMTIHQSKGLEFKGVFLYKCSIEPSREGVKTGSVTIDKEFGILTKVPFKGNYFNEFQSAPVNGVYDIYAERKNLAELKRLFYVAVTRSIDFLFISASLTKGKVKKNSFADFSLQGLDNFEFGDRFLIEDNLTFMGPEESGYELNVKPLTIEIPVIRNIDPPDIAESDEKQFEIRFDSRYSETIEDTIKNEIISATKIAMFLQCPVKYQLTYELGFSKLLRLVGQEKEDYELFKASEEEVINLADVRGRVVHSLLEKEVTPDKLESEIKQLMMNEPMLRDQKSAALFYDKVFKIMNSFFGSQIYVELRAYEKYRNEYEIYSKENDYYLFGIIDKLIIVNDRAIIVDYKTDNVDEKIIDDKIENYLPQLLFYSLLVSKRFKIKNIELRLIFLQKPERSFTRALSENDIYQFGLKVKKIVNDIRQSNFNKRVAHCSKCHFADDNNICVKQS